MERYARQGKNRARRNWKDTRTSSWFAERKGVFVFFVIFGILMGGFYIFMCFVPVYNGTALPAYHHLIAGISAKALSFLGENATATEARIFSPRFSVQIKPGCDAVEATALFVCAVLAFPASFSRKAAGIIGGVFALAVLNLVRVASLFLIGVHLPGIFSVMHIEVWQGLFIIFAVMLWVLWLVWIVQNPVYIKTNL
ncbi:MAG: exosortase H [Sedimentisphaerales bacterium]